MARELEKLHKNQFRDGRWAMWEQRNHIVVKDNRLIQKTRYSLSLSEQKLLLHLIQRIKPDTEKFEYFEFSLADYCNILGLKKGGKTFKEIKSDLKALSDKSFFIQLENDKWQTLVRWIDKVRALDEDNQSVFQVKFDDDLKPYLLGMKQFFTQYNYFYIMAMRSQYSIRLYELLKSYLNMHGQIFTVKELREYLVAEESYPNWQDFKKRTLNKAVNEINLLTDIKVDYKTIKKGRSVNEVAFYVEKKTIEEENISMKEVNLRLSK